MSVSFSMNRKGARCGSNFLMCSTSKVSSSDFVILFAAILLAAFGQKDQRGYFATPIFGRPGGIAAIVRSAGIVARRNAGLRYHARAVSDTRMIGNADLATDDDEISKLATARKAGLRNHYAVPAHFRVVPNLHH